LPWNSSPPDTLFDHRSGELLTARSSFTKQPPNARKLRRLFEVGELLWRHDLANYFSSQDHLHAVGLDRQGKNESIKGREAPSTLTCFMDLALERNYSGKLENLRCRFKVAPP
jgi:hypothetical protein